MGRHSDEPNVAGDEAASNAANPDLESHVNGDIDSCHAECNSKDQKSIKYRIDCAAIGKARNECKDMAGP